MKHHFHVFLLYRNCEENIENDNVAAQIQLKERMGEERCVSLLKKSVELPFLNGDWHPSFISTQFHKKLSYNIGGH